MTAVGRIILLVVAALTTATLARAQDQDPAAADALFREARVLMQKGDYAKACPKFAESQRLDPGEGTLANLAECYEKTGKLADALAALRELLDRLPPKHARVGFVQERIAAIEPRVPKLTIQLASTSESATVKLNGVELAHESLEVALPVNPGEHVVEVMVPGRETSRHVVTLGEGEVRVVQVEPGETYSHGASEPTERVTEDASTPGGGPRRTIGFVIGGAGLLVLAAAGYFALDGASAESSADDLCDPVGGCNEPQLSEAQRYSDDANDSYGTAEVLGVLGGVAVAGGVVLVLTAPSNDRPAGRLRIAPMATSTGVSIIAGGTW